MKLLFDENLSDRLLGLLTDLFPGSMHVKQVGLLEAEDIDVWEHARQNGFVLVTKDRDYQQLSAYRGAPPKVVWLRFGNRSTQYIADQLRRHANLLETFFGDATKSLLILAGAA